MTRSSVPGPVGASTKLVGSLVALVLWMGVGALVTGNLAGAAELPVGLGTAGTYAVLGAAGVTNTGPSVVNGDLGSCPTPAVTGLPPLVVNGAVHQADAEACGAQADLAIAYDDAAGRAPTTTYAGPTDLGGTTLTPGVYMSPTSFAITGTLTLDALGDPDAVFVFQAGSAVVTATGSGVSLVNGAQACNVYWQVGSSATLGVDSTFVGTILALAAITADTGAVVEGRLLARVESVTLDTNVVTSPACAPPSTTSTSSAGSSTSTTAAGGGSTTSSTTGATTSTSVASTTSTTSTGPGGATTTTVGSSGPTTTVGGIELAQATSTTARPTTKTTGAPGTTRATTTATTPTTRPSGTVGQTAPTTTITRLTGLPRTGTPAWWKVGAALLAVMVGWLMVRLAAEEPVAAARRDWTA